jgi:cobalt-zinc-cadmium efflux system membrane fusion protein
LGALAYLAWWGHQSGWQLPAWASVRTGGAEGGDTGAESTLANVKIHGPGFGASLADAPAGEPTRIEFPSPQAVKKVGIAVASAEVRNLLQFVTANGMVDYEPSRYARLTARTGGTVWRVYKEIGDRLKKGEVIALLDSADVGKFKADFLQSLGQVKSRGVIVNGLQAAHKTGAVPDRTLLEAETALREARIRLLGDQQALLNLGLIVHIEDVLDVPEKELAKRIRLLGIPEALQKSLNTDSLTANLLPITAPFEGVVVERNAAVGETVHITVPKILFVVADVRLVHVDLDVNPEDMAGVRVGQQVWFRADGSDVQWPGSVSHISPEVDEKTRRVRIHAEVPNPDGQLRPNAFGVGRIKVGEHTGAVVIPVHAVQSDGAASLAFVRQSDTMFQVRRVRTGLRDGHWVEVEGIKPGEDVVTSGSFVLKSELFKNRIVAGEE